MADAARSGEVFNSATILVFQAAKHHEAGRQAQARQVLARALAAEPDHATALHLMGLVDLAEGRPAEALAWLEKAVAVAPDEAALRNTLAAAFKQTGDMAGALAAMERAVALDPEEALYRLNLAGVLKDLGRRDDAGVAYETVLEADPDQRDALDAMLRMTASVERTADALHWCDRVLGLDPRDEFAWKTKVQMHTLRNEAAFARRACREGLRHLPRSFGLKSALTQCLPYVYDSNAQVIAERKAGLAAFEELLSSVPRLSDPLREAGATNFAWAYQGQDTRPMMEALAGAYRTAAPSLEWTAPHLAKTGGKRKKPAKRAEGAPLKVGFVSSFFWPHSVSRLAAGLIRALAAESGVEVTVFSLVAANRPPHAPIASSDAAIVHLPRSLGGAREAIAEAAPDVLVYPEIGLDPMAYLLAFARLAPVQCATWGYPQTTGIPNVDYFLSSALIDRPDAEADYSETLVRFAALNLLYADPPKCPPPIDKAELHLGRDERMYLCCQSLIKLHPDFDDVLAAVLAADPKARLVFVEGRHPQWGPAFRKRLRARLGKDAGRLSFVPRLDRDSFVALMASADVILDPPHWSGGNTVLEAIAIGAPLVTMEGRFMRGRFAAGCLRQAGCEALVAKDAAEYVAIATHLAGDPQAREDMGERMRQGLARLTDNPEMVAEVRAWMEKAVARAGV